MAVIPIDDLIQSQPSQSRKGIIPIDDLIRGGQPKPVDSIATAESRISSRPSAMADLIKKPITFKHPLGAVLRTLGGAAELYQGVPASIALDLQRGKPKDIISNLGKVVTGQRPVQYGDVFKGSGLPEPLAATAGLATDIALTPGGTQGAVALGKGTVRLAKGAGKVIKKPIEYVKEAFIGGEKAKIAGSEAKFALRQSTAEQARNISKTARIKTDIVKSNQDAVNKGYDELEETMKKMVSKEADKQGLSLQKDLPELFGKKSSEYGAARDTLVKGKNISVPAKDSINILEDALEQHGILRKEGEKLIVTRAPMTPAEHEVFSLWSNTRSTLSDNPNAVVMVEDLMKTQKFIQPEFGRAWTPDDKLKSLVSKGLDTQLKKSIPGYKEFQKKHAPFLKWKESAINKLEPFKSQFEVEKSVLSKLGSKEITESEQRLMAKLNDVIGKQVGGKVPALQKGITSIADKKALSEQASAEVIKKMRSDAAEQIFKLRQMKNVKIHDIDQSVSKLVHKYQTRRIKLYIAGAATSLSFGAVGTNSLRYFLTREIYSGVHGN